MFIFEILQKKERIHDVFSFSNLWGKMKYFSASQASRKYKHFLHSFPSDEDDALIVPWL